MEQQFYRLQCEVETLKQTLKKMQIENKNTTKKYETKIEYLEKELKELRQGNLPPKSPQQQQQPETTPSNVLTSGSGPAVTSGSGSTYTASSPPSSFALVINTDESDDGSNEGDDDSDWSNSSKKKSKSLIGKEFNHVKGKRRGRTLESLIGKEFKNPRRKCSICGCKLKIAILACNHIYIKF